MTCLAEFLLYRAETGHEILWIALLIALQIGAAFFKLVTGQTTAIIQDAHMRLMDEIREAPLFAIGRERRKIDAPPFTPDIVNAVAFRA